MFYPYISSKFHKNSNHLHPYGVFYFSIRLVYFLQYKFVSLVKAKKKGGDIKCHQSAVTYKIKHVVEKHCAVLVGILQI